MRIVARHGCVGVRIADEGLRREVQGAIAQAGIETQGHNPCPGPELACIVVAPGSCDRVAEVVGECAGDGPIPPAVVLLAREGCPLTRSAALDAGADELLAWPAQAPELPAVLRALTRRRRRDLAAHPLTGLPGGGSLHETLGEVLAQGGSAALLALDIERFKAFNDCYGFARGDEVLGYLGRLLQASVGPEDRVFHLGGDDFFVLTCGNRAPRLAQWLAARFDADTAGFYDTDARKLGYVVGTSRETGRPAHFELMSLSVVVAGLGNRPGESVAELAARVAKLKLRAHQGARGRAE